MYGESIQAKFHESRTKLKPNLIFNDFSIYQDLINKIDSDFLYLFSIFEKRGDINFCHDGEI